MLLYCPIPVHYDGRLRRLLAAPQSQILPSCLQELYLSRPSASCHLNLEDLKEPTVEIAGAGA